MSYCSNCGAELPDGARFCASCGTAAKSGLTEAHPMPAESVQPVSGGAPYAGITPQGSADGAYAGGAPYAGMAPQGNADGVYTGGAPYAGMAPQGNADGAYTGGAPYAGMAPQGNADGAYMGGAPYAGMPPYGKEESVYANGQPYGAGGSPYAGGQVCGNGEAPYAGGQVCGAGEPPYVNGQTMNDAQPYQGMAVQAGVYPAQDPYCPYGSAVQPQSSRKALAIIGMIVGLIVAIAVILLIVLLTRDNSHRTYQQAVGVFMDGLKRQDMDRMMEAFPERLREGVQRDMIRYYDSEREFWEDYNESLEWYCGKHVKLTYKIVEAEPLLDYQIQDYEKDCLEDFQYDVSITSGYELEIEVNFKGSEDEFSRDLELDVVEIGGKWYVIGY